MIPKSKKECFALLDEMLSKEDKKYLLEDDDAATDVHFSLGMWIRNNWLHQKEEKDVENLMKDFVVHPLDLKMMCFSPDVASHKIIESYIENLSKKS